MRMYLIRHGETLWNQEGRCQGFSDIELNKKGVEQAGKLANSLKDEKISAIYSSPLKRAKQTAQAIANLHEKDIIFEDRLKEINQGILEGTIYKDLKNNYKELLEQWFLDPCNLQIPEGESLIVVQERAWRCIEEIIARHNKEEVIVIVSHNLTLLTIICRLLNLELKHFRRLRKDMAAKTIIEFTKHHPVLVGLNDTSHLYL